MYVEYITNNSGGSWWLSDDDDWKALEAAGWKVFITDTTTGLRRKVVIYAEKSITYYARIIE